MITDVIIGNDYSSVKNGKEVFTGKLTSTRNIVGREHKLYRLEDSRGNYCLFFANEAEFVNPNDVPVYKMKSQKELSEEPSSYHSTYVGNN